MSGILIHKGNTFKVGHGKWWEGFFSIAATFVLLINNGYILIHLDTFYIDNKNALKIVIVILINLLVNIWNMTQYGIYKMTFEGLFFFFDTTFEGLESK